MHRAYYSSVLDHAADEVWSLIRDFNNYPRYIEGVTESVIEDGKRGDEVGAVRRFNYGGEWIRQRLTAHSDADRSFTYAGLERFPFPAKKGADAPAPVAYEGTLRLTPIVDGDRTFVEWFVDFDARPNDAAQWTGLLLELISQWVDSLRRTLAGAKSRAPGSEQMKEFAVIVSIHLKPGKETEFLGLLMPVIDAVRHESTFINNFLHQDPGDPTRFMVYENWADQEEFFDVQMRRDYRKPYESRLPELLAEPRRVDLWRPLRTDIAGQRVPRASYTMPFAFNPDRVWQAIRSFRDYEWGEGVGPGVIEGGGPDNEVGSVRAFTYYGAPSRQRLTAHSDADRTYSWESCAPYESIDHYEATLKVEPVGDQASKVTWTWRYEAPEAEAPKWDAYFAEESRKSLTKLRNQLERAESLKVGH